MDVLQKGIITLIQSAITGKAGILPEGFDIAQIHPQLKRHELVPLAYEGAILCGVPKDSPTMAIMFRASCQNLAISVGQMRAVDSLCRAFDENGIDHMPLKGCNMKALYPKPEMRIMSDADILIRVEQYDKIEPVMRSLGYMLDVESDHEIVWKNSQLYLELHKRLMPSYNQDYHAYFGDGWRLAKKQEGCRYAMSLEDDFIFQFVHFAKHYRAGGIGCRHITDLWVFRRAYPDLNEEYMIAELQKLRLADFYRNILDLIGVWFEGKPETDMTRFISDFIFQSGSWGTAEAHVLSDAVKAAEQTGSTSGGRFRMALKMLFPPVAEMRFSFPVLDKAPWLLPVLWPVRWVRALLFRRDRIKMHRQELEISSADSVSAHQKALNYVGLSFGFEE